MIHRNEAFDCKNCKKHNEKATKSCRNHCKYCLFSMHVDDQTPGDRLSKCLGLMEPIALDTNSKKGHQIIHQCTKCEKIIKNLVANDDDVDAIIKLTKKQNVNFE